jgi:hypothetical protein
MKKERIEKAVEVINYAIQNNVSVKEASVKMGFADTYVKNIKAVVYDEYENNTIEDELFNLFETAYQEYRRKGNKTEEPTSEPTSAPNPEPKSNTAGGEQTTFSQDGNKAHAEWKSGANYPPNHIKSLEELLQATNVDTDLWKVKNFLVNKWDVTSWKNEIPETVQNFQVKAWLEKNIQTSHERAIGDLFREMIKNYVPPVFTPKMNYLPMKNGENNLFEVTLFDLHIGKLAWGGETGENYDTKIARDRFLKTIETLIERASGFAFNRILFPIGNDFFNSDTILNTTTKGTPQDEDLRWQKTFEVGVKLLVDAINFLKQLQVPVDVLVIPGNHDFERSFYMGSYLQAWFNNDPMVNINNGASPRKYYRFGNTLLGFTHGSEEKESSLPMLMSIDIESKPMWSDTLFHEWHLGHIHRKRDVKYTIQDVQRMVNEDLGVTVRYLSSLTGTEEWHHKKGFVGATKAGEAFIWNDELGLIAHLNANLIIEKYEE